MHRAYLTAILGLICQAASAETNLNLTLGARDQSHPNDRLPALGFAADFGRDDWLFRPELGLSLSFDPVGGGDEAELSAGAVGYWDAAAFATHFGVGVSSASADLVNDSETSLGIYVHGGLTWGTFGQRMGFDVRYLKARESTVGGAPVGGDYVQLAFLIGW
jgi:hypothetical protein